MKTIGMIGGISWVSSVDYYRIINEQVNARLGGLDAARMVMYSVNYGDIKRLTDANRWDDIAGLVTDAAKKVEAAGSDCLLLGANTMHRIAPQVQAAIDIPLIHIAEATAKSVIEKKMERVALLGTRFTMELDFFKKHLADRGIETLVPAKEDRDYIHQVIYNELGKGVFRPETKAAFLKIMTELRQAGAQGIILGCTEIPMLLGQQEFDLPLFDTTLLHATAAVDFAFS